MVNQADHVHASAAAGKTSPADLAVISRDDGEFLKPVVIGWTEPRQTNDGTEWSDFA